MPDIHALALQEAQRTGGGGRTARSYFDFYVSGTRLLALVGWADADYITPLGWGATSMQERAIAELLRKRKPSLPSGRSPIYICPECGDIGCGALTVRVERQGENIIWHDFAFENGYEEPRTDEFSRINPLHLEVAAYWQTLSAFRPSRK